MEQHPVGIERLRTLYAVLAGLPDEKVALMNWRKGEGTDEQLKDTGCGTTGCAVGWACAYPPFKEAGLSIGAWMAPVFGGRSSWSAVESFFGLSELGARQLFYPVLNDLDLGASDEIDRIIATYGVPKMPGHFGGRFEEHYESAVSNLSERKLVMRRIRRFLMEKNCITVERNAELALQEGMPA